ncbi:MAPEG family protein [compost metagenome]
MFYAACIILLQSGAGNTALVLAWTFVGGRVLHSLVQILTTNIRLRGAVFTLNFLAVLGLWAMVVLGTG